MTAKRFSTTAIAYLLFSFAALALTPFVPVSLQAVHAAEESEHVKAALVADTTAIVPGKPFKLGVELKMDPGWHTYYKESGDAGMPTRITWTLPAGFKASELIWQKPHKFTDAGITTYGYQNETLVAAEITPPANLKVGDHLSFTAEAKWLACRELCMPGNAKLSMKLPVAADAKPANSSNFSKLGFNGPISSIEAPADGGEAASTPASNTATTSFSGDILDSKLKVQGGGDQDLGLGAYLGLALIGGFILNFMPCVLPVISIKVLSFMEQAGDDPKRVFKLGLTFSAGIISAFMALAGLVAAVKAAGQNIGWGFQFQFPIFLFGMAAVVLVFVLSLFGLVYFQFNAGQGEIDKLAQKEGVTGTFFKGVLATTLSTPCSAPFLGTALGFAFSQPMWVVALIFFTIGVGMAAPYIVLTARPEWMRYLPRPGVWMEKFKESMGFLLLATVVWLVWVLGQQVGLNAAMAAVGFLVCLSFAVWLVGRFIDLSSSTTRKSIVYGLAAASLVGGYVAFLMPNPQLLAFSAATDASSPTASSGMGSGAATAAGTVVPAVAVQAKERIDWQPFTVPTLNEQLKAGKTVFIDFTADWCLTCKVNESTVLNTPPVIQKLKELHAVTLRADWTRQDPAISALLQKFGRSGVPLYVVFPAANPTAPIVLPEVITQQLVIDKLTQAGPSK